MKRFSETVPSPRKLALAITLFVLIALSLINLANYTQLSESVVQNAVKTNMHHTISIAGATTEYIDKVYSVTEQISLEKEISGMDANIQENVLKERLNKHRFIYDLSVQKLPDGEQTVGFKDAKRNRLQCWWFERATTEQKPFVSKVRQTVVASGQGDEPVLGIYFPIISQGECRGVLAASISLKGLKNHLEDVTDTERRMTFIIDSAGAIVIPPSEEASSALRNLVPYIPLPPIRDGYESMEIERSRALNIQHDKFQGKMQLIIRQALAGERGNAEIAGYDGETIIVSYTPISLPGSSERWAAVTIRSKTDILANIKQNFKTNIFTMLCVGLMVVLVILRKAKRWGDAYYSLHSSNIELENANRSIIDANDQLQNLNSFLAEEIACRAQAENSLRLRERQHRVTIGLLVHGEDEEGLLAHILYDTLEFLQAEHGYIALADQNDELLKICAGKGAFEEFIDYKMRLDTGISAEAYRTGEAQYVNNYQKHPRRLADSVFNTMPSIIFMPLKSRGEVLGVLAIGWMVDHIVSEEEREVIEQYAHLAAIALESAKTQMKIKRIAFNDPLTNMPNRASMQIKLEQEMTRVRTEGASGAAMFIDIDDLKMVNDTFGHSYGDAIIIRAAAIILAGLDNNSFVARIGGDDFMLLLFGETDRERIGQIADKLIEVLNMEYQLDGISLHISASVGIALYPEDASTASELMKNVDNALYAAKHAGKNCWRFYDPRMQEEAFETITLTNSLRNAIKRRELFLVYQPQIRMLDGKVVGLEALLRWKNPTHGFVSPMRFIKLAEQSGLITQIGIWVLGEACRFAAYIIEQGIEDCTMAVNVSPNQLADADFVANVQKILAANELAANKLEIEITESAVIHSLEEGISKMLQLKHMGVRISLDDFGTGYSSLTHLQRLPVGALKIDKSFIDAVCYDAERARLVVSIIDMAKVLGLKVVVEGIEDGEQFARLRDYGCDFAQGYHISKPLSPEEAIEFLQENRK